MPVNPLFGSFEAGGLRVGDTTHTHTKARC